MSAPSKTHCEINTAARDGAAHHSGNRPADEVPAAEHAPPVCPVTATPVPATPRAVTRNELQTQVLRLEVLLSLWRLEHGSLAGFWDAHPESISAPAMAANFDAAVSAPIAVPHPEPVTDPDYISQVAFELFGNQAA